MEELGVNPAAGAPDPAAPLLRREPGEVDQSRRQHVTQLLDNVRRAHKHWEDKVFKGMRDDMLFARGLQWPNPSPNGAKFVEAEDRYSVNLVKRHLEQRTAALYAKNPRATARRRDRLYSEVWDGSMAPIAEAQMALMQATAMGLPPLPQHAALLMEFQRVQAHKQMLTRFGKTLELLYDYYIDEQVVPFKRQMKQLVRRVGTTGVGYVKLGFQRVMGRSPEIERQIADTVQQLAALERLAADLAEQKIQMDSAEADRLRLVLKSLADKADVIVREGLTFSFPRSTAVIPCPRTRHLQGFVGASFVAEYFPLTGDEIKEIYGVDVSGHATVSGMLDLNLLDKDLQPELPFAAGGDRIGRGSTGPVYDVYEIYVRKDGLRYVVCNGWPDFLEPPAQPEVKLERFYPWYALTFNDLEDEANPFPPSDVHLLRHPQMEYNRAREGLRRQRIARRPKTIVAGGMLEEDDKDKLQHHPDNAVIELNGLQPGQKVEDLLQPFKGPPIDPALYDDNPIFTDILRAVGTQEAIIGGTSGGTATESSIAEGARLSSLESNVDDLDDFLSELARAGGQVLLANVQLPTVKRIVGEGAVWPQLAREEIAAEVFLEVEAGSTGRPNKVQELQNFERVAPLLLQIPGIDPEFLAREGLRRLDDRLDLSEAIKTGVPSITALNTMAGRPPAQPGATADPAKDPGAQGAQGRANGPQPAGSENQPPRPGRPPMQPQVPTVNAPV